MIINVSEGEAASEGAEPRRRLTQAEAKERTRQQLLAAAARVFAQKGFAGASLEEIAEAAGYSTGAVYYNFAGKEELFLELIRGGWPRQIKRRTEAVTRVFAEAAESGGDPFDALSAFVAGPAGRVLAGVIVEPKQVGMALFGPYLLGVEMASMLLLAGLVGAYHLGRRPRPEEQEGGGT